MNFAYILSYVFVVIYLGEQSSGRKVEFLMPNVRPMEDDTYLCIAMELNKEKTEYITDIQRKLDSDSVHHIGFYSGNDLSKKLNNSYNCKLNSLFMNLIGGATINTPMNKIKEGFGIQIGKGAFNNLVLQVHYNNVSRYQNGETDNSGVILTLAPSVKKRFNMFILSSFGAIPPHQTDYWEGLYRINQPIVIHILYANLHTHSLGRVVSGYIVSNGTWTLIRKGDPLSLHHYSTEEKNLTMKEGDFLAIRCTFESDRDNVTRNDFGFMGEMCMFTIFYYVDGDEVLKDHKYLSFTRWKENALITVPDWVDRDASILND